MNTFSKMFKYIPGFRTKTKWKMLVASIYYFIALSMITESTGHLLAAISIPFVVFYFIDLLKYRRRGISEKKAIVSFTGSMIAFFLGIMMIPISQAEFSSERGNINLETGRQSSAGKDILESYKNKSEVSAVKKSNEENAKLKKSNSILYNKVSVKRIVDGDTIVVEFSDGREEKVRFIGVNTPETVKPDSAVEPYGKEASDYTKRKLSGRTVYIENDVGNKDEYGRLLRYIWLAIPEKADEKELRLKMFNSILLLNGYARVMTIPPDVKYAEYFRKFENEAHTSSKGLWGLNKQNKKVELRQDSTNQQENVSGSVYIQNVDLKREVVVIKNNSNKNIDMSGWKLRSEKGSQTYFFPKGFILKKGATVNILSGKEAKGDGIKTLKWTNDYVWNNEGDPAKLFDWNAALKSAK